MSRKKLSSIELAVVVMGLVVIATMSFFFFTEIQFSDYKQIDALIKDVAQRAVLAIFLILLCFAVNKKLLVFDTSNLRKQLLCLLPCLAVAVANFPISALLSGAAVIEYSQYVWLFLIQCLLVGFVEEVVFRGIFQKLIFLEMKKCHLVWQVLTSAAAFGLWHFVNLFFGASFGSTLLQVGYSFLLGAMLSVLMYKTNNIWWCILVHALFDVGGTIVFTLGHGNPWDTTFWIETISCGVVCTAWCVYEVFFGFREEQTVSENNDNKEENA